MIGRRKDVPRLLLVDDEADFVAALADVLADLGYEVNVATSAQQALDSLERSPVDLAVLDYRMPDIDGIELHRLLRAKQSDLESVLLTAFADAETHESATDAGFWTVLEKPVDVPSIERLVASIGSRPD